MVSSGDCQIFSVAAGFSRLFSLAEMSLKTGFGSPVTKITETVDLGQ